MSKKLCIYAKGDTYDQLHTMVGLVSTAASMDWEAHVYMTYGVLWRFCQETMSEAEVAISTPEVRERYVRGIDAGRIPDLDELFEEAQELGGSRVKIYACPLPSSCCTLSRPSSKPSTDFSDTRAFSSSQQTDS